MVISRIFLILPIFFSSFIFSDEMILDEVIYEDLVKIIFEVAPKDTIISSPKNKVLSETETDIHLEVLINWSEDIDIMGQIPGSFIPYISVTAIIENEITEEIKNLALIPHLNLIDGFHYAQNIKLPGSKEDKYSLTFFLEPDKEALSFHKDWQDSQKIPIISEQIFSYKRLNFAEIVETLR